MFKTSIALMLVTLFPAVASAMPRDDGGELYPHFSPVDDAAYLLCQPLVDFEMAGLEGRDLRAAYENGDDYLSEVQELCVALVYETMPPARIIDVAESL